MKPLQHSEISGKQQAFKKWLDSGIIDTLLGKIATGMVTGGGSPEEALRTTVSIATFMYVAYLTGWEAGSEAILET